MTDRNLQQACNIFIKRLEDIIGKGKFDFCLYGSAVLDDFHLGLSDIDILVLTHELINETQGNELLNLREEMYLSAKMEECKYFEGAIVNKDSFFYNINSLVVYWGTNKQRFEEFHLLGVFDRYMINKYGICLYGNDYREKIALPTYEDMIKEIKRHFIVIRENALQPSGSIYSIGWLFDIARGLYSIQTGDVTSKTNAAKWAIENKLVPDENLLQMAINFRKNPELYKTKEYSKEWLQSLGPSIQEFADVLESRF